MTEQPRGRRNEGYFCCPICGPPPREAMFSLCDHERDVLEAEERVGMRRLRIDDYDLGASAPGCRLEAYCRPMTHENGVEGVYMAVQPWLSPIERRARELEAHGYYRRSGAFLRKLFAGRRQSYGMGIFLFGRMPDWEPPAYTVAAIGSVVEEMEPGWVESVREARRFADDLRVVAAWCELPLQAVLGCVRTADAPPGRG